MLRTAVYDLECTSLKGDVARLLCGSILSLPDGDMKTFRQDEIKKKKSMADDAELARLIRDELNKHHMVVTWHGKGFDDPMLRTRLAAHGMESQRPAFHFDAMYAARGWRGIKLRNSKLSTVAEFFDLPERKMDVDVSVWIDAAGGDKEAMDILVERCESDVRLLKEVGTRLLDVRALRNITMYP